MYSPRKLKRESLRKLFAVLAVAVAELAEDDVCALTGFDVFDLLNLPWAITRWFTRRSDPDTGKMSYAFAHPLLAREFGIALGPLAGAARRDLLQFCSRWQENGSRFALQHYAGQLADADCGGELYALAREPRVSFRAGARLSQAAGFAVDNAATCALASRPHRRCDCDG